MTTQQKDIQAANIKAGSRLYKSLQIPENAVVHTNSQGREFYISGATQSEVSVRFIDTGEFLNISWGQAWAFKPFYLGFGQNLGKVNWGKK